MTKKEYFDFHRAMCDRMCEVTAAKNSDYSNGLDPFRNFRKYGAKGFLVRIDDKISRLESLLEKDLNAAVENESFEDTCLDLANYALLLAGFMRDSQEAWLAVGRSQENYEYKLKPEFLPEHETL